MFWEDLAELKCLAVSESVQGQGVGRRLVEACWEAARELEIKTVFTLTYVAEFFEQCGYHRIDKADLPHKIWNECVRCPLFPNCHEIALIRVDRHETRDTRHETRHRPDGSDRSEAGIAAGRRPGPAEARAVLLRAADAGSRWTVMADLPPKSRGSWLVARGSGLASRRRPWP